jgi:hypothetical protein
VVKGRQRVQEQHEGTKDRVCGERQYDDNTYFLPENNQKNQKNQQQPPPPALPLFHLLRTSSFSFRRRWYPPVGLAQVVDLSVIFSRFLSFAVRSRPFSVFSFIVARTEQA